MFTHEPSLTLDRFRWVFCQLEVLQHCFPPSVRRTLQELPESLDETYERILREIRKLNQGHAHRLMQCLGAAVRPLHVEELVEALAFDFESEGTPKLNPDWRWEDQEEAVMSACSGLVIVVKNGNSRIVQFSHFSVKEFLMSDRLAESSRDVSRYHILLERAHTTLAQACLGVLLRLDNRIDCNNINRFPLARYAAEYWVRHTRFGNVSSRIKDGMECLFDADKPHFATWLWIHNDDEACRSVPYTMCPEKPAAVPLYYAARLGLYVMVERLLAKHPEDVHAKGGLHVTPLHASASKGHTDVFSLLIEHFPDVDTRGLNDYTPLHSTSFEGHLEIGQRLINRGADVNARSKFGITPLYLAAANGRLEFAQMLLNHKADINAQLVCNGWGPLHVAMIRGQVEAVRWLLEHGADLNACDNSGRSPSDIALDWNYEMARLLSEYKAKSIEG